MVELLLIIIVVELAYMIYFLKQQFGQEKVEKRKMSYKKVLSEYLNKNCEIIVKEPMPSIDIMFSVKGILMDLDDEWLVLEVETKKKKTWKMFRISNIESVKEIK